MRSFLKGIALVFFMFLSPGLARGQVTVVSASYGANMGASGNATADLRSHCDHQFNCSYTITTQVLGDPYPGWGKDYLAYWTCPGDGTPRTAYVAPEAGFGSTVTLVCPVFQAYSTYEIMPRVQCCDSQYEPFVLHVPNSQSYIMYRCKNTTVNGKNGDRVWRSDNTNGGMGTFVNDQIAVEGGLNQQDDLSCAAGVVIDNSGTWHMYYLTANRSTFCSNVQIWHATSTAPGVTWTKHGQISGVGAYDCSVGPPSPALINGQIVLYFTANGGLFKASTTDGHNFTPPQSVGGIQNFCSGRVTYYNGDYWFIYARSPGCAVQPTTLWMTARVNDDNFQEGIPLIGVTAGQFYATSVGVGHLHPGDPSRGDLPRIYYSGNPAPACSGQNCLTAQCSDFSLAIGIITSRAPNPQPPIETSYLLKTAESNEQLPGWPASYVLDRNANTDYSSFWHPTASNTTGLYLAAWRPSFPESNYGPALVNSIRLTPRNVYSYPQMYGLGFPQVYDIYLTTPTNSAWDWIGRYTTQPYYFSPVTISLPKPRGTWGALIVPQQLGVDNYGGHYLQMAEIELLFRR